MTSLQEIRTSALPSPTASASATAAASTGAAKVSARLVLVGDHNLFRECLASMLAASGHFAIAAQASTLDAARCVVEESAPDLVLYDGGTSPAALESLKRFTDELPDVKVVALGLEEDEAEILPFIEAGAAAYVLKEVSLRELGAVLEKVLHGGAVCSPKIASTMFSRLADLSRAQRREEQLEALQLTPRELEILEHMAAGSSNKEIASALCLSFHTVKNHVHNILEKLHVGHRTQAVEHALRKRWIRGPAKRRS